jgi:hypothetical protein
MGYDVIDVWFKNKRRKVFENLKKKGQLNQYGKIIVVILGDWNWAGVSPGNRYKYWMLFPTKVLVTSFIMRMDLFFDGCCCY